MRGIVIVALAEATLIAIGLILGVPLVVPLAVLIFLGAFIPIVGATLAGAAAVLVALVTQGFVTALIVLAVALAISTGTVVAGIGGTVAAVPLVAAVYAAVRPREQSKDPPQESEQ